MSAFNKCKDCGSTAPESGWVTKTASLCVECAKARDDAKTYRPDGGIPRRSPSRAVRRAEMMAAVVMAGMAGGLR